MSPRFRRDRDGAGDDVPSTAPEEVDSPPPAETQPGVAGTGAAGPYDADDPEAPTIGLVDLGGLRVPAIQGMQLRLDVDKNTNAVVAVTLVSGASAVQLTAFAAPRSQGLWDEIREEVTAAVAKAGGSAEEAEGEFGTELLLRRPTTLKDGRQALQIQRYCGVEGPRWLLRAVFTGPDVLAGAGVAVPDDVAAKGGGDVLREVVRGTVVVRGPRPMAPRDPLPLVLPEAARKAAEKQVAERQARAREGGGTGAALDGGAPTAGAS